MKKKHCDALVKIGNRKIVSPFAMPFDKTQIPVPAFIYKIKKNLKLLDYLKQKFTKKLDITKRETTQFLHCDSFNSFHMCEDGKIAILTHKNKIYVVKIGNSIGNMKYNKFIYSQGKYFWIKDD